jgi:nucleoside-diphosphate-sugar epimerase
VRATVLGGTGFIGRHVIRLLAEMGAEVSVIHRGRTPANTPGIRSLPADRESPTALSEVLTAARPDVLIDMIAYTGSDAERLAAILPASLRRLIVISSGDVYRSYGAFLGLEPGALPHAPLDETAALRRCLHPYRAQARNAGELAYSYEKILVEQVARRSAALPVTVLRLPMVYGPGDPQHRVGGYLDRMLRSGSELRLNPSEGGWRCTRGYVEDVAWAIALAAQDERAMGETLNVGEADALAELEWARAIAAAAGWPGRIVLDPEQAATLPVDWRVPLVTDSGRLRTLLGYRERVGRAEGLRRTVREAAAAFQERV